MSHKAPYSGMSLLVVDDDAAMRTLLTKIASSWSFETEACASAEEALRRMEQRQFNIIISDVKMGKMDGIQFAETVREKMPATAVIIMTGYPSEKTAMKSLELGATYYLSKPIGMDDLGETLRIAAAWNIGKLTDRAAHRFHGLYAREGADGEKRVETIKEAIRNLLRGPGFVDSLRDFVYNPSATTNALLEELKKRFVAR